MKTTNFILIDKLICLTSILVLFVFLCDLYYVDRTTHESTHPINSKLSVLLLEEKTIEPLDYYEKEISGRNIFKQGLGEYNFAKSIPTEPVFKELLKDLCILGIVSGVNKQVIIEDAKSGKTYFLFTGDYVGEIEVKAIYPDRVELEFKGEKISLFL